MIKEINNNNNNNNNNNIIIIIIIIIIINQKKLYKELGGDSSGTDTNCMPDAEESCEFWSKIWDNPIEHNRDAEWLADVRDELGQCSAQEDVKISEIDFKFIFF